MTESRRPPDEQAELRLVATLAGDSTWARVLRTGRPHGWMPTRTRLRRHRSDHARHRGPLRYLGRYGSGRVRKAVLLAAIPPFLLKTDDNPEGVDRQVFKDMKAGIFKDRSQTAAPSWAGPSTVRPDGRLTDAFVAGRSGR